MSDDEKDVFEEAIDNMNSVGDSKTGDVHTEINLDDPEPKSSDVARTSVTEIVTNPKPLKEEKMVPRSGQYIHIKVCYPEKIGSGMGSYFVYKVTTSTNKPSFLKQELVVKRRFSDFLGLHERLESKYLTVGCIIPPAPEKDAFANTKTKLSKEDQTNSEFLERRRLALERYLQRIAKHPRMVVDSDFREFLEDERDLPRSYNTQAFSGANVKKLIKNVGEAVGKITVKTEECDKYFEEKQIEMDNLERHLTMIHSSFDALIIQRKELAAQSKFFATYCSQLSHVEEHTGLARALASLSTTQESISKEEAQLADGETAHMLAVLKEYLGLVGAVKAVLAERQRQHKCWQETEMMLTKKREQKVRAELANKHDRIPAYDNEIKDLESRVDRTKEDFENMSKAIHKELEVFDVDKVNDFKEGVVKLLETMITCQENIIQYWESFAPETTGISS